MELPSITVLTLTCARVRWLENAIHAFIQQDYKGQHEMLIVNTFPRQNLYIDPSKAHGKTIRIINLNERPTSLGKARNMAVESAAGRVIVILDDDDYILPHHLSTIGPHFGHGPIQGKFIGNEWIWLDRQFWGYGNVIKEIVKGQCPCFAYTKDVWRAVGGYPDNLTVGEDRALINKITKDRPGHIVPMDKPSFVYCWNNGCYHASGQGDDQPGRLSAHERYWQDVERRVGCGVEPTGQIALNPNCRINWPALAAQFHANELKKNRHDRFCVVELGRFGDIINILPILKHIYERWGKPHLMVSREFASLLDGVSYVEPYPVDLENSDLAEAIALAKREFPHVLVTQIWGKNWTQDKKTEAYNMESWRMAGFLHKWRDPSWRPVFDRRSPEREGPLVKKVIADKRPLILVNVTSSQSSPFRHGQHLLAGIQRKFPKCNVMDLAPFTFHRIYDMLGLMEKAAALVSIDTALLHLAACVNVPLVALVNPGLWLGSVPRPNVNYQTRIRYNEAQKNPDSVYIAINRAVQSRRNAAPQILVRPSRPQATVYHATEMHGNGSDPRRQIAQRSWETLYAQGVVPCHLWEKDYPRNAKQSLRDPRPLPFLRDVLLVAKEKAQKPNDIIMFTNDDNYLHRLLPDHLRLHVALYDCCCAQRVEYEGKPFPPDSASVEEFAGNGKPHMGRDLFAFSKEWLDAHWKDLPDFVLGASDWDLCVASMIRLEFNMESTRRNLEEIMFPAELPRGFVAHQAHNAYWLNPLNVHSSPSQKHNRLLFYTWAQKRLPTLRFHANMVI